MKISKTKFLLFSSILAIFTEAFYVNLIIDWKLFYLILLINYIILVKSKTITFNIVFFGILAFFLIHGTICCVFLKIPPNYMLSQIFGITVISTYFYNFIKLYSVELIFQWYLKFSLFFTVLGFPMFFLGLNFNKNGDDRFCSIFTEPAHFAIVIIPACYYYLKTKKHLYFSFFLISLILSDSSLGYIGILLIFLSLISSKNIKTGMLLLPLIFIAFYIIYENNENVNMRVNETTRSLKVLNSGKFEEYTNISSYALISNLYVAKLNFIDHPFGSGIGSHYYQYKETYCKLFRTPKYIKENDLSSINAKDGASLFIRLTSDFGVFGLFFVVFVLFIINKIFSMKGLYISQGIAIYIVLKLLRDGHYFSPEFFLFFWLFVFSIKDKIKIK